MKKNSFNNLSMHIKFLKNKVKTMVQQFFNPLINNPVHPKRGSEIGGFD